jgi:uncharacterized membrane protein YczE
MRIAIGVTRGLVGITGGIQVVLGIVFWTGHARTLIPFHMTMGVVFVLALMALAVLSARRGAPAGLVAATLAWSVVIPAFGMVQMGILPGPAHWIIRLAHLLTGVVGMGLAGAVYARVAARMKPGPFERGMASVHAADGG